MLAPAAKNQSKSGNEKQVDSKLVKSGSRRRRIRKTLVDDTRDDTVEI